MILMAWFFQFSSVSIFLWQNCQTKKHLAKISISSVKFCLSYPISMKYGTEAYHGSKRDRHVERQSRQWFAATTSRLEMSELFVEGGQSNGKVRRKIIFVNDYVFTSYENDNLHFTHDCVTQENTKQYEDSIWRVNSQELLIGNW